MKTSTCLVLGGHGFVGSAVVAEANRRGFQTLAAGRKEYESLKGTACDLLINANGNSRKYLSRENPALDFEYSVLSVMRSLHDFRYDRYILLSSIDVYPDVSNPDANEETAPMVPDKLSRYGLHKYLAEQLVRRYAERRFILRMGGLLGHGLWKNPVYDLLTGAPLRVHPDSEYQYLNTADAARILFDLLERSIDTDCINVAGQGVISIREIAGMVDPDRSVVQTEDAPLERYEVNLERLKKHGPVPRTEETVRAFMDDVKTGRIALKTGDVLP